MKLFFKCLVVLMPWIIKRRLLNTFFGYKLHRKAYIGLSWIFPDHLVMEADAHINHFSVAIHLDEILMKKEATIGRGNWITGFSSKKSSPHFSHDPNRKSQLMMGNGAAITKNHHIDCTSPIEIGAFTTVAGYRSQLLTHSINIYTNRQESKKIVIGDYCFVGSGVIILGGAVLPSYSVLGAKSLLHKSFENSYFLYAGNPALPVKKISESALYFSRQSPFVV